MTSRHALAALLATGAALLSAAWPRAAEAPRFRAETLDPRLGIGYAVTTGDVNGDGKPDILAVNERQVLWYENPSWTRRVLAEGLAPRDNVCIAAADLDGDGKVEVALGSDWQPQNTTSGGTVHYLVRPPRAEEPWKAVTLDTEPTVHRMCWADIDGDGRLELVVAPLHGRGTRAPDWEGQGARLAAYHVPKNPSTDPWPREVIDRSLHVVHNLWPLRWDRDGSSELLVASFEGVTLLTREAEGHWRKTRLGAGNQESRPNRGASEVKVGRFAKGGRYLATIEPWHGNQVVVYTAPSDGGALWRRQVVDESHAGGHAIWCADLDGDGTDEILAGYRERGAGGSSWGVYLYDPEDTPGTRWTKRALDEGGVACEDLTVRDLNGDGHPDVVASGRATRNLRVYWNSER